MIRASGTDRSCAFTSEAPPRDEVVHASTRLPKPTSPGTERVVVTTTRSAGRCGKALHGMGAVVGSLAVHGVAAAAAIYLALVPPEWMLSQRRGKSSVALAASMVTPPPKSEEPVTVAPPDTTPPTPKSAEPIPPDAEPMSPLEKQSLAVVERPIAAFAELKEDLRQTPDTISETRAEVETPEASNVLPTEQPKRKSRPVAHALPRDSAVVSNVESVASASSAAATGVDSDHVPALVQSIAPVYSAESRAARESGVVKVRVKIDALGQVVAASIYSSSGYARLDQSALDAVRSYRFAAADGTTKGRAAEFVCPITFRLNEVPARR